MQPLEQLTELKKHDCVNSDASTRENASANSYFTSKKAAMVQMYPFIIADFEKALGKDLGVTRLPTFSDGPLADKAAGNSFHNWVIPAKAKNPDLAFAYVKIASDDQAGADLASMVGLAAGQQAGARRHHRPQRQVLRRARFGRGHPAARQRDPGQPGALLLQAVAGRVRGHHVAPGRHAER